MAKQPSNGPRAAAKATKKVVETPVTDESPDRMPQIVDRVPPEFRSAPPAAAPAPDPSPALSDAPSQDTAAASQVQKPAAAAAAPPRGGFVPLVFGGLVAGAIGFAVATVTSHAGQADVTDQIAMQEGRISALQQDIAALAPADLAPLSAAQDDLAAQIASLQDDLAALHADMDDRLSALATQGSGNGGRPDTSVFEAEIDALRSELTEMTEIARTELDAARSEAAAIEENAAAAARNAAGRAALARLQTSVETGAPLGSALADLADVLADPVPDALLAAQDGVPTLAALQDSFPAYARAALRIARAEGVAGEETTGLGAFLRNQFAVRSVNPQEGDTADAILSRAQAALRQGRLGDALSETNALPDVARAEMSEWLALAEQRADAVAAIDTLAASLRDN